ncbi:RICIN domain-containing protein [Streptomyces syringium]|uniref:RICIN domain-containing protein n=1 Tax=Streptomyces syringium TaxID=76729 RepID=UPI0034559739
MPRKSWYVLAPVAVSLVALASGTATAQTSDDGHVYYKYATLQAEHSGKCLTMRDTMQDGPFATQSTCIKGDDRQRFRFEYARSAEQMLMLKHSGKCLSSGPDFDWNAGQRYCYDDVDVKGQKHKFGNRVWWRMPRVSVTREVYELRPVEELQYCLTVKEGSLEDGAPVYVGRCSETDRQRWKLEWEEPVGEE